jgi:hypothetical protein
MGALLLAGCEQATDPEFFDRQFIPVGHWEFSGSGYEIDNATVRYYSPEYPAGPGYSATPASEFTGNIVAAVDFSETSGVLIVKITGNPTYDPMSGIMLTAGKYTGVYYKEYSSLHIALANPVNSSYVPIEVNTLNTALSTFTAGNMGDHVTYWGTGYDKK